MAERTQIAGAGGGALDVEISGAPGGDALVFHTGTPSDGTMYEPMARAAADRGLRTIAYARPGYGRSQRVPGRSVADCTADVAAIADALALERFYTVGWSGGGPHALACAALLPQRTIAAATIAGVAPREAAGLDWLDGMAAENLEEFAAASAGEAQLRALLETFGSGLRDITAERVVDSLGDLIAPADRAALTPAFAEHLAGTLRRGLADGIWGWLDDDLALTRDWGFALSAITLAVTIWQGEEDHMVPPSHGRWLAANIPGARGQVLEGEGHLSLGLSAFDRLLDDLLAH
jgi:pimeloyl-ACP methyl ester carboxylesterase